MSEQYTITITTNDGESQQLIYSQTVNKLDLLRVVRVINNIDEIVEIPIGVLHSDKGYDH